MKQRNYYSVRTGKNPLSGSIDLAMLLQLFRTLYVYFDGEGYFQEDLGFHCVDTGFIPGAVGHDLQDILF